MPDPIEVAPVRFVDPPARLQRTFAGLPRRIGGVRLRYETRSNRPDRGFPRVSDADWDLLIPHAVVLAGADPDRTWTVRAFPAGSSTPLFTVISDGQSPGSRWVDPIAGLLARDPAVTRTEVMIAGRPVAHLSGLTSSDPFTALFWPGSDTSILTIGRTAYLIATDDPQQAAAVVRALDRQ